MQKNRTFFSSNDARLLINSYGFAIFPVYGVNDKGECMCGDIKCSSPAKHPITLTGFKEATKDINKVLELWQGRKGLNVGIATGKVSDCFVVDIDGIKGEADFQELCDKHEEKLPSTLQQATGKGRHLFFKYPDNVNQVFTRRGVIGDKVDIRGDGGYVVGYKSTHITGAVYDFINPLEVIADAPQWLIDVVCAPIVKKESVAPLSLTFSPQKKHGLFLNDSDWEQKDIEDLLQFINPDIGYDEWYQIGMAIKDYGLPFTVWDNWSKGGTKYKSHEMAKKWDSFKGKGVTIGSIVYLAKQGGWRARSNIIEYKDYSPAISNHEPQQQEQEIIDEETGEIKGKRLPLVYAEDITPVTYASDFVEGLLRDAEFSVIYGASNCGKTFFMLDLAMHVAMGKEWRGRNVEQGGVIYAALEGGHGTKNRIVAFKNHYKLNGRIPLAVIPSNINFLDGKGDMPAFIEAVKEAKERIGEIRLIVIDTLARAIGGGDENSSMDMGQLIINADKIRELTNAHIAFVHHSGKNELLGARGHSSLRAAVDTEIEIGRIDEHSPSTVKVVKQREMEMIEDMAFSLERVVLGVNQRGSEVTSCVVFEAEVQSKKKTHTLNAIQTFIFDALQDAVLRYGMQRSAHKDMPLVMCVSYDELRLVMEERGFKKMMETEKKTTAEQIKSATQSARLGLKKAGKINFNGNYVWVTE